MHDIQEIGSTPEFKSPLSMDTLPHTVDHTSQEQLIFTNSITHTDTITDISEDELEQDTSYNAVIKESVMDAYNTNGAIDQELTTELVKSDNIKKMLDFELAKHQTLKAESEIRKLQSAKTKDALEHQKLSVEFLKEEKAVNELKVQVAKDEKAKIENERTRQLHIKQSEQALEKQEEIEKLDTSVKNEVSDLRVFEQKELKIKSLDTGNIRGMGAFFISDILENKKVWAGLPITVSDGSIVTISSLIFKHSSIQIADLVEPKTGDEIATLTISEYFKITITTPLRGGELYTVYFSPEIIKDIITSLGLKPNLLENLVEYLSESDSFTEENLKSFEDALKGKGFIKQNTNFLEVVHERIEEKITANLTKKVNQVMKEFHCEMIKGKPTFLDRKSVSYTPASLVQMFSGKNNQIVLTHPVTKVRATHNPAKLYLGEKMYDIYDGTVFYPAAYSGVEFNTFDGFKYPAEKLMYIGPFIDYVNKVGCNEDKQKANTFWSFFANIIQGNTSKYSALAIVSDEDELVDLLLKGFREVMEDYYFRVNSKKQLTGINLNFEDKLLVEIDDSFLADKSALINFEDLVKKTNFPYQVKTGIYESKQNYTSCIVTSSNHEFVSKLAKKKMLIVADVSSDRANDIEYLDEIQAMIDDSRFAPSLMYYLSNFNYQKYESLLKRPPVTVLSDEEIEEGFTTEIKWLYAHLQTGEFNNVSSNSLDGDWSKFSSKELHDSFISYAKSIGEPSKMTSSVLGSKISKVFKPAKLINGGQKLNEGDNAVAYGPLPKCREAFEKYTGLYNPSWIGDTWKVS